MYADILKNMPRETGMAFIVLAHCGIQDTGLLAQALSSATWMRVAQVEEGMTVSPNHVYVMPPGVDMEVVDGRFHLTPAADRRGWPVSISVFLHSVAASLGPRVVAVILSGVGFDGSSEMEWIKASGGVTLAQSHADHPDMPVSAEKTGYVDAVLSWQQLAAELQALAEVPVRTEEHPDKPDSMPRTPVVADEFSHEQRLRSCRETIVQTQARSLHSANSLSSARSALEAGSTAITDSLALLSAIDGFLLGIRTHCRTL